MEGNHRWQRLLRGILLPSSALFLFLIFMTMDATPGIDDYYTKGLSRWILNRISALTSRVSFSIAEPFALLILAVFILWLARFLVAFIHKGNILKAVFRITDLISLLVIIFLISWGFNYRQIGLAYISSDLVPASEVSLEELEPLVRELMNQAQREREAMGLSEDIPYRFQGNMGEAAIDAYRELAKVYPDFATPVGRPKPLASSRLFSQMGIAGIFIPYTGEANYNDHQPELLKPASILHELAHLKGIALEGEANFTAYLASRYSEDPQIRYSATMLALFQSGSVLMDMDEQVATEIFQLYSPGVKLDIREYNLYWRQFQGRLQDFSRELNDVYLRTNGQEGGVNTYLEMVNYLVNYQEAKEDVNQINDLTYVKLCKYNSRIH